MFRWRTRRFRAAALAMAASVVLIAISLLHRARPEEATAGDAAPATTSARTNPLSCKPSPAVLVTLAATPNPGAWRVHLEALVAAGDVVLRLGSDGPGPERSQVVAWRGALAPGEGRDLEVRYDLPAGAARIWAEVAANESPGSLQRSRVALRVVDGKALAAAEPVADAGRRVVDPATGEAITEYPGQAGGGR